MGAREVIDEGPVGRWRGAHELFGKAVESSSPTRAPRPRSWFATGRPMAAPWPMRSAQRGSRKTAVPLQFGITGTPRVAPSHGRSPTSSSSSAGIHARRPGVAGGSALQERSPSERASCFKVQTVSRWSNRASSWLPPLQKRGAVWRIDGAKSMTVGSGAASKPRAPQAPGGRPPPDDDDRENLRMTTGAKRRRPGWGATAAGGCLVGNWRTWMAAAQLG